MQKKDKGRKLENAVQAIERLILENISNVSPEKLDIRLNYREIKSYEIDVYVKVIDKKGYDSIYIFECKNWDHKKVERKDITDFSEKIIKANAQRGFFVAKNFTKGAIDRIEEDSRMVKVMASNFSYSPLAILEAKILDKEKSKFKLIKTPEIEVKENEIKSIQINGKIIDEFELVEKIFRLKNNKVPHAQAVKEIFQDKDLIINGIVVTKIKKLEFKSSYLPLNARIESENIFGIENRGSQFTVNYYYKDEHIFDGEVTTINEVGQLVYNTQIKNAKREIYAKGLNILFK